MSRIKRMTEKLKTLAPTFLDVTNESEKHRGHVEHLGGAGFTGETHYKISISSPLFKGLSRIECHRLVNEAVKLEFSEGLHALEIKIL